MGGQASVGGGVRGGAGAGEMMPGRAIRVSGGGGVAPVGLGSAPLPPPPRRAVESVASPGGDRLQRLAMAEISFAEKELYAPKTGKAPCVHMYSCNLTGYFCLRLGQVSRLLRFDSSILHGVLALSYVCIYVYIAYTAQPKLAV